jgi:hypothetical protein
MPRPGGESDKLGNRYEGFWTVLNVLDLLTGDAVALEPEPLEESRGIEFIKTLRGNSREFHSVKRQRAEDGWRLSDLVRPDARGRSVLGDLFEKIDIDHSRTVVFVSATIHPQAYEIWDRCCRCETADQFEQNLRGNKGLHEDFFRHVLPRFGDDLRRAFQLFRSLRLVQIGENEIRREIDRLVRLLLYRVNGEPIDSAEVTLKLADYICSSLGRSLLESEIRIELERHGYYLKDWARDQNTTQQVEQLNARYLRHIQSDLILGKEIPRPEAVSAIESLLLPERKLAQIIVGAAGRGKSCVVAQIVKGLRERGVPILALRFDNVSPLRTTKALGQELGLPDSPALVLAGISQGNRAVLVVDQLDALSIVSGRGTELWEVFEEMIEELRRHPNLRLLLACREFDLKNDPRLSRLVQDHGLAQRIDLGLLPIETVKSVVGESGGDPGKMPIRQLELLRLPFHLHLFLQGEPKNPTPFRGRQELFARFWTAKREHARKANADFEKVVGILSDELSRHESISIPANRLDEVASDAQILVSENVLVLEGERYRFFHEGFFDYAFARRFVRQDGDLIRFLTRDCGEQHLFRRAQMRQILAYQRDDNRANYLETLRSLFLEPSIRLHLKKLALDWLAQIEEPTEEEWEITLPLLTHPLLHWAAFNVLWGKLPWFDLLNRIGAIPKLLENASKEFVNRCFHGLSQKEILELRSAELTKFLRPYLGKSADWDARFRGMLQFGHFHHSDEMFAFVLDLHDYGLFDDDQDEARWYSLVEMAEKRADFAVEFLGRALERLILLAKAKGEPNPFSDKKGERSIDPHFIQAIAVAAPASFVRRIAPIVENLVLSNARPIKSGGHCDEIWPYYSSALEYGTHESILGNLRRSLGKFAQQAPHGCRITLTRWIEIEHRTLRSLLFAAWLGNPAFFAEEAVAYFVRYPLSFVSGHEDDLLSVIKAISPIVSDETHGKLETAIHGFRSPYETDKPRYWGDRELTLFRQLTPARLSRRSRLRIEELQRKFLERRPHRKPIPQRSGFGFIPPPIPATAFEKMTDEQVIGACRKYSSTKSSTSAGPVRDLFTPIKNGAKSDRKRFARIALKMPDDIEANYFDAILWGLADESRETVKGENGNPDIESSNDLPLEPELLMSVVRRVHKLPGRPCGQAICRVADLLSKYPVPVELVEIVADYALYHPDPQSEVWDEDSGDGKKYEGGDPLSAGIGSTRGSAADSFSRFLFDHPEMGERLLPYVESLALDKSIAVRAVNVQALTALLNTHRDKAVELFLKTCEDKEALWKVDSVEHFIYYATFTHYAMFRPLLQQMLKSKDRETLHAAGRQITVAAFRHDEAREDTQLVLAGDPDCRRAAAEIYAVNVHHESVREDCLRHLMELFDDPEKLVRDTAADWFHNREGLWTDWQRELLVAFSNSLAFADGGTECARSLEKTHERLPPEFLGLANRAVELFEKNIKDNAPHAFRFQYHLPALTIRFYEQTKNKLSKKICLDLIDKMLGLGWGEVTNELNNLER